MMIDPRMLQPQNQSQNALAQRVMPGTPGAPGAQPIPVRSMAQPGQPMAGGMPVAGTMARPVMQQPQIQMGAPVQGRPQMMPQGSPGQPMPQQAQPVPVQNALAQRAQGFY